MLKTRVITALLLLVVFIPCLFLLPQFWWALFVVPIAGIGAWEWGGFMQIQARYRIFLGVLLSVICFASLVFFPEFLGVVEGQFAPQGSIVLHGAAVLFWLILAPLWLRYKWHLSSGVLGAVIGLLVILPAWAALVQIRLLGPWHLLAILALVWVADSAAYFFGCHFGRHKLAVTISPGKTWEGALGAAATVLVYGLVMRQVFGLQHTHLLLWVLGLPALTALSIVGDLFESLLKRQAGLKDSSHVLPGHGGVLDRIDSQTSTLPLLMVVWIWLVYL